MPKLRPVTFKVDDDEYKILCELANGEVRTVSGYLRWLIDADYKRKHPITTEPAKLQVNPLWMKEE